jgi:putative ABC transport system ATP-binding protein
MSPVELRRSVGIVLQHAPIITGTVYDNLALPLQLQKKTLHPDEALTLLQEVGLPDLLKQEAKDLSGGQKQRVAIARTLVNKPNILLLDEITASLDREAATEIEQLLLQINKKFGTTMIWITHDLHQAKRVGDYMCMLADGKLIETGEIDVLHSPKSTELQHFLKGDTT